MKGIGLIIVCCFLALCGQVCLKIGFSSNGGFWLSELTFLENVSKWLVSPIIVIGICLCGITAVLSMYLLDRFDLTYLYPWTGIAYVFAFIAGVLVFGEDVRIHRIIGSILIVAGVIIVSKS